MGGKALKTIETKRLNAREYHALVPIVLDEIAAVVGRERSLCVIEAYRQKADFGDMDILVASDGISGTYEADLEAMYRSREVCRNGNVTSFDRDGFQVDVIAIPQASFDFARTYFAWNDLGNLMGCLANKIGVKFAFEGLLFPLRDDENRLSEVVVTRDAEKAMAFLGYDVARYKQGFDTPEDMFRFAASTPYFDPSIYLLENIDAKARVRVAKRKTYSSFLQWLREPEGLTRFLQGRSEPVGGWYAFPEDKTQWHAPLRREFPVFSNDLDSTLTHKARQDAEKVALKARHAAAKAIFNGEKVAQMTGLSRESLGELMDALMAPHATREALNDWVLSVGQAGVDQAVLRGMKSLAARPAAQEPTRSRAVKP